MATFLPDELIQCPICLGELTCPRTLPCLHTFCENCLQNHIKLSMQVHHTRFMRIKTEQNQFPCPTCRKPIKNPDNGMQGFPKDFRVMKLIDMDKHFTESDDIQYCGTCSKREPRTTAESFCIDCEKYICQICKFGHEQKPVLASHIIISVPQTPKTLHKCNKHLNESTKYFCSSCDYNVCIKCVLGDHGSHDILNNDASCANERLTLRNSIQHMNQQIWSLHDILFNLTCIEGKIKGKYEETKINVRKHTRKILNKINGDEFKLLSDIDDVYHQHTEELYNRREQCQQYVKKFRNFKTKLENILRVVGTDKVIDSYMDVLQEIQKVEMTEEYRQSILSFPNFVNFIPGETNMVGILHQESGDIQSFRPKTDLSTQEVQTDFSVNGDSKIANKSTNKMYSRKNLPKSIEKRSFSKSNNNLLFSYVENTDEASGADDISTLESSNQTIQSRLCNRCPVPCVKLLSQIGGFGRNAGQLCLPYGLTFTKNDKLAVAENGNRQIQIFDMNGKSEKIISTRSGIPRGITGTVDGKFVITDEHTKCIMIVTEDGNQSIIGEPWVSFPFGIATMPNGNIVVSDMIHENISIISLDGAKISQFGCHGFNIGDLDNPSYLTSDEQNNIFVSDSGHHEIKVFDLKGSMLCKFGGYGSGEGQMKYPKGVVVDKNGLVIVADSGNDRVVAFSKWGTYQGVLIDKNYGIDKPTGLAYSNVGLLAVSMPDAHEVFIYELNTSIPSVICKLPL